MVESFLGVLLILLSQRVFIGKLAYTYFVYEKKFIRVNSHWMRCGAARHLACVIFLFAFFTLKASGRMHFVNNLRMAYIQICILLLRCKMYSFNKKKFIGE